MLHVAEYVHNLGQWYLPPGFDGGPAGSESADDNETNSDEIDLNDADERSLRLAFAALKAQSNQAHLSTNRILSPSNQFAIANSSIPYNLITNQFDGQPDAVPLVNRNGIRDLLIVCCCIFIRPNQFCFCLCLYRVMKTEEEEVDQLRRRLEETERAMERICRQMGNVTDKLSTSAVELLSPLLTDQKVSFVGRSLCKIHSFFFRNDV